MEAFIRPELSSYFLVLASQLISSFTFQYVASICPPSANQSARRTASHESYQRLLRLLPLRLATSALHPDAFWCHGLKGEDPIKKALAECIRQLGEGTAAGVPRGGGGSGGEHDCWRPGVREPEEADAEQVQPDTELTGVGHGL